MIILIILIILVLLSFNLFRNLFKNDATILDDVKLKEEEPSNNGFALMLETENVDGTTSYVESNSSTWPTGMKFNSELSGCIDVNGNKIDNALSFDTSTNAVMVSTNKTAYCYVYFDLKPSLAEELMNTVSSSELWDSTLEDDGYRYVGTDPSNYICFGTTDKDICLNDTDKYMYRIIGIFEDSDGLQYVKLIKKEALNTAYQWNLGDDIDWNNSDLYKGLNGSYFLTNTDYSYMQNITWTNKIAKWNYTMTNTLTDNKGVDYSYNTAQTIYLHELNRNGKSNETCYYNASSSSTSRCSIGTWINLSAKISLMYISDYALSLGSEALGYTSNSNYSTMKTGWMHLSNNDSEAPSSVEWTMSRFGDDGGGYHAWYVFSDGNIYHQYTYNDYMGFSSASAVRPVFYLTSDVKFSGGTGIISDPFLLD